MYTLVEKVFTGKWRSFKIFRHSGAVHLQTEQQFSEFDFCERKLVIAAYADGKREQVAETAQWAVIFKNRRYYLNITVPRLLYEVITINHTVMVLADQGTGEKIFFAKENVWQDYLRSNHNILL